MVNFEQQLATFIKSFTEFNEYEVIIYASNNNKSNTIILNQTLGEPMIQYGSKSGIIELGYTIHFVGDGSQTGIGGETNIVKLKNDADFLYEKINNKGPLTNNIFKTTASKPYFISYDNNKNGVYGMNITALGKDE